MHPYPSQTKPPAPSVLPHPKRQGDVGGVYGVQVRAGSSPELPVLPLQSTMVSKLAAGKACQPMGDQISTPHSLCRRESHPASHTHQGTAEPGIPHASAHHPVYRSFSELSYLSSAAYHHDQAYEGVHQRSGNGKSHMTVESRTEHARHSRPSLFTHAQQHHHHHQQQHQHVPHLHSHHLHEQDLYHTLSLPSRPGSQPDQDSKWDMHVSQGHRNEAAHALNTTPTKPLNTTNLPRLSSSAPSNAPPGKGAHPNAEQQNLQSNITSTRGSPELQHTHPALSAEDVAVDKNLSMPDAQAQPDSQPQSFAQHHPDNNELTNALSEPFAQLHATTDCINNELTEPPPQMFAQLPASPDNTNNALSSMFMDLMQGEDDNWVGAMTRWDPENGSDQGEQHCEVKPQHEHPRSDFSVDPESLDWLTEFSPESYHTHFNHQHTQQGAPFTHPHPQTYAQQGAEGSNVMLQGQPLLSHTQPHSLSAGPSVAPFQASTHAHSHHQNNQAHSAAAFIQGRPMTAHTHAPMCMGKPISTGNSSQAHARNSCSGVLEKGDWGQQQGWGQPQDQGSVLESMNGRDLLSWLEDPALAEAARAAQIEGGGDLALPTTNNSNVVTEAAQAAAEAAAMAVITPPHTSQFGDNQGVPLPDLEGTSSMSGAPFFGAHYLFGAPDADPSLAAAAAAAMANGFGGRGGGEGGMDGFTLMLDQCNLPGLGGPMGFGGPMMGMGLPGMGGMLGGGMGMMGAGYPGMMPMPGMMSSSMSGLMMGGGAGGSGKGMKGSSGGGGKKQRENLPKQSVTTLKIWLYDHINHPYPTEMEKNALMQSTGLDLLQLNNWFINARVRIWRPIIVTVYQQQYERLLALAHAQGDAQSAEKLREAYSSPPSQLNILLNDAFSTQCLHEEAQRHAAELHSHSVPRLQRSGGSEGSRSRKH